MDAIVNHIWQSTLVAGLAAALALMLRHNQASVRYWVWFGASMKFLMPFAALSAMGSALPWPRSSMLGNDAIAAVSVVFNSPAIVSAAEPFSRAIAVVWLLGTCIVLAKWSWEWTRVAAIARAADPITDGPVHDLLRRVERAAGIRTPTRIVCSPRHLEPGVFGVAKPVLIWPLHLTTGMRDVHIEGILAHEIAHVKRRDNLLGVVQMLVSAACWFHPMVWWIGARMIDERERACDEQVLALGQSPSSYAAGILETCEMCITSTLVNVPGVTGGDLKKRICRIMRNEQGLPLGTARKAVLIAAAVALVLVPALDRAGAAPARQPAQDDDPSEVHQPGGDVQSPRLLKEVKPHYSERAKNAKIEGEVLMECVVGADGKPRDFTIVRSLDPELDQAALDAARLWEFEPGTRRGKPVAVKVTIAMAFTLK